MAECYRFDWLYLGDDDLRSTVAASAEELEGLAKIELQSINSNIAKCDVRENPPRIVVSVIISGLLAPERGVFVSEVVSARYLPSTEGGDADDLFDVNRSYGGSLLIANGDDASVKAGLTHAFSDNLEWVTR